MVINNTLFSCIIKTDNMTENIDVLDDCSTYIGFGSENGVYAICVISILSFLLNFIFLIFQHIRIRKKKKKNRRKISMRKLYQILTMMILTSHL